MLVDEVPLTTPTVWFDVPVSVNKPLLLIGAAFVPSYKAFVVPTNCSVAPLLTVTDEPEPIEAEPLVVLNSSVPEPIVSEALAAR